MIDAPDACPQCIPFGPDTCVRNASLTQMPCVLTQMPCVRNANLTQMPSMSHHQVALDRLAMLAHDRESSSEPSRYTDI